MIVKNNLAIFLALSLILHAILVFLPSQKRHFKPKKAPLAAQIVIPPPAVKTPEVEWVIPESTPEPPPSPKKIVEKPKPQPAKPAPPKPAPNALIKKPKTWKEEIFEQIERQKNAGLFYPKEAILQGLEGTAEVMIFLNADGSVLAARLETSSGHAILDEAAVKVARALKTLPRDAPAEILLPIVFRLD